MPKLDILNISGDRVGEIELNENVYGAEVNEHVLYEVVKNYLANQRQGTQSAKTRAEVRGGGKKPFRQKGTGNARQGTIRAPHFVGGGVAFAPKPRDYSYKLPKKVKRLAFRSALSSKINEGEVIIIDSISFDAPKTREMVNVLANIKADRKALVVTLEKQDNVVKSASNIKGVEASYVGTLNVYEILKHTSLVMTKEAAEKIGEVYA
ncbi:MAG: 50S ribosomal protein L4 [Acidaminobacteraceae bacterium]